MEAGDYNLKNNNLIRVYKYLYDHHEATKMELVYALHLSLPTVTQDLEELLANGRIIVDSGKRAVTKTGRPAAVYTFDSRHHISFGVEVLANKFKVAAVDLYGSIILSKSFDLSFENSDQYFQKFGNYVNQFIEQQQYKKDDILGITIAIQGIVDKDNEHMLFGKLLNNSDFSRTDFGRYLNYPVSLIHDTEAAAIAENWHRSETSSAFFISLNKNMGSAFIINNSVVHMENLSSGTIEHMTLYSNGRTCYCGKRGCSDAYCSAESLEKASGLPIEDFFRKKKDGNHECQSIWRQFLYDLATVIDNVRMVVPRDIILGGTIDEYLTDDDIRVIMDNVQDITTFKGVAPLIMRSRYGTNGALMGSALTDIISYLQRNGLDI